MSQNTLNLFLVNTIVFVDAANSLAVSPSAIKSSSSNENVIFGTSKLVMFVKVEILLNGLVANGSYNNSLVIVDGKILSPFPKVDPSPKAFNTSWLTALFFIVALTISALAFNIFSSFEEPMFAFLTFCASIFFFASASILSNCAFRPASLSSKSFTNFCCSVLASIDALESAYISANLLVASFNEALTPSIVCCNVNLFIIFIPPLRSIC